MKGLSSILRGVGLVLIAASILIASLAANVFAQSVAPDHGKQADGSSVAAAYRALHRKNTRLAERRFRAVLAHSPDNGPALAGMGYIAMRRQDFAAALHWLEKAERHGQHNAGIRHAVAVSRFWLEMKTANSALEHHQLHTAETAARRALALRPDDSGATLLLARILAADGRLAAALALDRQVAVADPANVEAWSGWLKTSASLHQPRPVLAVLDRLPPAAGAKLRRNFEFLAAFSDVAAAAGHPNDAENAVHDALALPAGAASPQRRRQAMLQLAWLYMASRNYDRARQTFRELLAQQPDNVAAWQGIVLARHLHGHNEEAWQSYREMPPSVRAVSQQDPSFLRLLAGIDQSRGRLEQTNVLLNAARKRLDAMGQPTPAELLRQQAGVMLTLQQPEAAVSLYRAALARNPKDAASWYGLLNALHLAGKNREAAAAQLQMSESVRDVLESDPALSAAYFRTMASVEQSTGNLPQALVWLKRLDAVEVRESGAEQSGHLVDLRLREGWLEYNLHQDDAAERTARELREALASPSSLTGDQRQQIADLTANLAVRRATALTAQGKRRQAVHVLDIAARQVRGNAKARIRLATGYLTAGEPAVSIAIYQSVDMRNATVGDMKAAIGAAMETRRKNLAQQWLARTLASYPKDPGLLLLAGEFAQSNGNLPLAKKYLRAVLAASREHPASSATNDSSGSTQRRAADLLATIESSYSNWLGATAYLNHVSGTPGVVQLTDIEIPVETSIFLGERVRLTAIARTVRLDSGDYSGLPSEPLGTLAPGVPAASSAVTGVGGTVQLATRDLAAGVGVTPSGFPVRNITAAATLHVPRNPWTLSFDRASIRESQLSYASLHDPAAPGNIWGGVVANLGTVQYARGNARSGWYATVSAGAVTGSHVRTNPQVSGDGGAYWQVWARPSAAFRLGMNFYGQHNTRNELFYTYGHGGYFSPNYFLLPSAPLTVTGHEGTRLRYQFAGSLGAQIYSERSSPWYPLDAALQSARGNPVFPAHSTFGLSYGTEDRAGYLLGQHWRVEAFFRADNAQSYNRQLGGVSLHYLFRAQRSRLSHIAGASGTAGWFPHSGLRPYLVP